MFLRLLKLFRPSKLLPSKSDDLPVTGMELNQIIFFLSQGSKFKESFLFVDKFSLK